MPTGTGQRRVLLRLSRLHGRPATGPYHLAPGAPLDTCGDNRYPLIEYPDTPTSWRYVLTSGPAPVDFISP